MSKTSDSSTGQSTSARTKQSAQTSEAGTPAPGASGPTTGVIDQAKQTLSNAASQAGEKVTSGLDSQKDRVADQLSSLSQALRQAGEQMSGQDQQSAIPQYLSTATDKVDSLADSLRRTDARQVINGLERFARRQPALFLGSAFAVGLLAARFLKSSSPQSSTDRGEGRQYYAGSGGMSSSGRTAPIQSASPLPTTGGATTTGATPTVGTTPMTGARPTTGVTPTTGTTPGTGGTPMTGGTSTGSPARAGARVTRPRED